MITNNNGTTTEKLYANVFNDFEYLLLNPTD